MLNATELADRYVALWNEPDADARRTTVGDLWVEGGGHVLHPPAEVLKAAEVLGLGASFECRGHDALAERVRIAYEEFVGSGNFTFRRRDDVARLRDMVKFTWEMVGTGDGAVVAVGTEVLLLDGAGRIQEDYQFIER